MHVINQSLYPDNNNNRKRRACQSESAILPAVTTPQLEPLPSDRSDAAKRRNMVTFSDLTSGNFFAEPKTSDIA